MNELGFELLIEESIFGLGVMALVIVFNLYCFSWISLSYRQILKASSRHSRHIEMLRYAGFTLLLVLSMLLSLSIWVFAMTFFNFVEHWTTALLFTASFFTSVGNITVQLPFGWRLIPSIIAFSGLFSFAWATASSIGMARDLSEHLAKNKEV